MKKPELLAPAGDLEKLKIALLYGADAVFIGGKAFSLRARASNFDLPMIEEAMTFAHALGKKVYVTVNMIPHQDDLEGLIPYLKALEAMHVDAIIAAAASVIDAALTHTRLPVHLSTQQSTTNVDAVNFWASSGLERVVLAREVSLDELKTLAPSAQAELEVFIHGGMCVSYSGKCTLSNTMTDRDANRGGCAHSCRWNYDLLQEGEVLNQTMPFSMSSKDLQAVKHISSLIDLGIDSLKIEGRMKSIHYIATVVKTYRQLIDDITESVDVDIPEYLLKIKKAENRLSSHGFMEGMTTVNEQLYNMRSEEVTQQFIGVVKHYDASSQTAVIEQRNKFALGDVIEVFSPTKETLSFKVERLEDEQGVPQDTAPNPKAHITINAPFPLRPYDLIRKVVF